MTHRIGQGCAVLQQGDGCLAAGHGLGQLLHGVPSVGEKFVIAVEDDDLRRAVQSGLHTDGGSRSADAQGFQRGQALLHLLQGDVKGQIGGVLAGAGEAVASQGHAVNCQRKRRRQQRGQLFRRVGAYPKGDDANA